MVGSDSPHGGDVFSGVRFVLFGFDSVSEEQYRSELISRGGVDVGRYDLSCTHVIVSGRVYDDPVCVAARNNGKALVTELWIEDSVDFGILADTSQILYRPVRDMNGIPGGEMLFICLTGYQRRERDNIMKMVNLMGAHFLKPLIATKVTHLICYKFEGDKVVMRPHVMATYYNNYYYFFFPSTDNGLSIGEKYEVAKRTNMKLVNRRWLEDCLKSWEILSVNNYRKSDWELDIMEAEASNSKENGINNSRERQSIKKSITAGSIMQNAEMSSSLLSSGNLKTNGQTGEAFMTLKHDTDLSEDSELMVIGPRNHLINALSIYKESNKDIIPDLFDSGNVPAQTTARDDMGGSGTHMKEASFRSTLATSNDIIIPEKVHNKLFCASFDKMEVKSDTLIYSRKSLRKLEYMEKISKKADNSPRNSTDTTLSSALQLDVNHIESAGFQNPTTNACVQNMEGEQSELSRKSGLKSSILRKPAFVNSGMPSLKNPMTSSVQTQFQIPLCNSAHQVESSCPTNHVKDVEVTLPASPAKKSNNVSLGTIKENSDNFNETKMKSSSLIYSRKSLIKSMAREEISKSIDVVSRSPLADDVIRLMPQQDMHEIESAAIQSLANADFHNLEEPCDRLPQRRQGANFSFRTPKPRSSKSAIPVRSLMNSVSSEHPENPLVSVAYRSESFSQLNDMKNEADSGANDTTPLKGGFLGLSYNSGPLHDQTNIPDGLNVLGTLSAGSPTSCKLTNSHHGYKSVVIKGVNMDKDYVKTNIDAVSVDCKHECVIPSKCQITEATLIKVLELPCEPGKGDIPVYGKTEKARQLKGVGSSCSSGNNSEIRKLLMLTDLSCKTLARGRIKKVVAKKRLSRRNELSAEHNSKAGSSVYSNEVVSPNESTLRSEKEIETENGQKGINECINMVGQIAKEVAMELVELGNDSAQENAVIDIKKDTMSHATKRKVMGDSSLKLKEKEAAAFRETTLDKKGKSKTTTQNIVKGKVKKSRTKNASFLLHVSGDANKENKTPEKGYAFMDHLKDSNMTTEFIGLPDPKGRRMEVITNGDLQNHPCQHVVSMPAWFILSGPSLQRKEYQKVIWRLKGRLCRDAHNWSYRATHLIVFEPLRRTEKFFAAAASGRWILKADYLVACNEAGKFLDEEPFEWYANELKNDGTISLAAPRKWRLLQEKTGHGAFYNIRIIIYGECIAPSLDTLKRVIKAGDGIILATSPPYTRLLKSGVDFAVISAGTPLTDLWVQEFLKHNIACVLADYLVDYVCKPDCSLDKHVLYKTHAQAATSLANHLSRFAERS